jgi:medium-chain acyl-[acyl-carrier-protein] hydrolase
LAVPGAGSGAGFFRGWDAALPGWIEFYAVSAPGREQRIGEPAPESLQVHVDAIVASILRLTPLPLALLGHSMGAIVAWEVARGLRSHPGHEPRILFPSAMLPPHVPAPWEPLSRLPDRALLDELRDRFGGFPPELDRYPELRDLMLRTVRRDLRALESHTPAAGAPLEIPVHLLAGRLDRAAPPEAMAGWAQETSGPTSMSDFPGGHDYMAESPGPVAKAVVGTLRRLLGSGGSGTGEEAGGGGGDPNV